MRCPTRCTIVMVLASVAFVLPALAEEGHWVEYDDFHTIEFAKPGQPANTADPSIGLLDASSPSDALAARSVYSFTEASFSTDYDPKEEQEALLAKRGSFPKAPGPDFRPLGWERPRTDRSLISIEPGITIEPNAVPVKVGQHGAQREAKFFDHVTTTSTISRTISLTGSVPDYAASTPAPTGEKGHDEQSKSGPEGISPSPTMRTRLWRLKTKSSPIPTPAIAEAASFEAFDDEAAYGQYEEERSTVTVYTTTTLDCDQATTYLASIRANLH